MRLNPVKCKEMFIDFLHYKPRHPPPLQLSESEIERVHTYKMLGVYVTDKLRWSTHCEYIVQRACKRLYALRCLKKSGVMEGDLVLVYSSLIRSVLEYASPVWENFPKYLSLLIEGLSWPSLQGRTCALWSSYSLGSACRSMHLFRSLALDSAHVKCDV